MSDAHIQALQVQVQALRAQVDTLAALVAQETDARIAANEAVARSAEEVAKVISASGALSLDLNEGAVAIDIPAGAPKEEAAAEQVDPVRLGGVVLYGELAKAHRAIDALLRATGKGYLSYIESPRDGDQSYVVQGGQVFINRSVLESGLSVMSGLKIGIKDEPTRKPGDALLAAGLLAAIDRISSAGNGSVNQRLDDAQQEHAPKSEFESARDQGFDAMTEYFAKVTDDTCLAIELQAHDARQVERIRQVIREELRPGGMLHSR